MHRVLTCLLVPVLLASCSSGPDEPDLPPESAFREGTCRLAAADLRELGRTLPELGDDGTVEPDVQETLARVQDRLFALSDGAEPEPSRALDALVEVIGGVRIRAVGGTYEPSLGDDLQASFDEVLAVRTTSEWRY